MPGICFGSAAGGPLGRRRFGPSHSPENWHRQLRITEDNWGFLGWIFQFSPEFSPSKVVIWPGAADFQATERGDWGHVTGTTKRGTAIFGQAPMRHWSIEIYWIYCCFVKGNPHCWLVTVFLLVGFISPIVILRLLFWLPCGVPPFLAMVRWFNCRPISKNGKLYTKRWD